MDSLEMVSSEMIQVAFWLCTFFWAFGKVLEFTEFMVERLLDFIIKFLKKEFNSSEEEIK